MQANTHTIETKGVSVPEHAVVVSDGDRVFGFYCGRGPGAEPRARNLATAISRGAVEFLPDHVAGELHFHPKADQAADQAEPDRGGGNPGPFNTIEIDAAQDALKLAARGGRAAHAAAEKGADADQVHASLLDAVRWFDEAGDALRRLAAVKRPANQAGDGPDGEKVLRHVPCDIRAVVVADADGQERGRLWNCTLAAQPCGCRIVGNGTLPHPLDIERCPAHAAE